MTLQQWRNPLDFDPIPYWQQVRCPVLAIYAENDENTPTARNVTLLADALKRAGNTDYTITVLRKTGHAFYAYPAVHNNGYITDIPETQRYVPGYVDRMMNWLSRRLKSK